MELIRREGDPVATVFLLAPVAGILGIKKTFFSLSGCQLKILGANVIKLFMAVSYDFERLSLASLTSLV